MRYSEADRDGDTPDPRGEALPRRVEPPVAPFRLRTSRLAVVSGCIGVAFAWLVTAAPSADPGGTSLSFATVVVLGASIGGALFGALARARGESIVAELALGAGLGVAGAVVGSFCGLVIARYAGLGDSWQGLLVARMIIWSLTTGFLGMFLAFRWANTFMVVPFEALLWGSGAGVVAGVVMSLPGPSELWRLPGLLVIGAGTGIGVVLPVLIRSLGIIELQRADAEPVGLTGHRGWIIPFHGIMVVETALEVRSEQGRCRVAPAGPGSEPVRLGEQPVTGPLDLLDHDTITIGSRVFLYRRFPGAGL